MVSTQDDDKAPGVRIGNVSGGIHGSIVAGRDVSNASIQLGDRTVRADETPTQTDVAELLADISKILKEIADRGDDLSSVSSAAPFAVQGAAQSVRTAADRLTGDVSHNDAVSARTNLTEAAKLVETVVDTTDQDAKDHEGIGSKVKGIAEKLGPLLEKLAVAAVWVSRLWLGVP